MNASDSYLPPVRCSAELRERLERIARQSVSKRLSDHLRLAVENYVAEIESTLPATDTPLPVSN